MLADDRKIEWLPALYALQWLGASRAWTPPVELGIFGLLFRLWRINSGIQDDAALALSALPLLPRNDVRQYTAIPQAELKVLFESYDQLNEWEKPAALVVAWYMHALEDAVIARRARELLKQDEADSVSRTIREILEHLGEKLDPEENLLLESDVEKTRA